MNIDYFQISTFKITRHTVRGEYTVVEHRDRFGSVIKRATIVYKQPEPLDPSAFGRTLTARFIPARERPTESRECGNGRVNREKKHEINFSR